MGVLEECQLDRSLSEQGAEEKVSGSRNKDVGWIKSRNNHFRHPEAILSSSFPSEWRESVRLHEWNS